MRQLKGKIKAEKNKEGRYIMICKLPNGKIEYPQEGLEHDKRSEVFDDARVMYNNSTWNWNERYHTIDIDMLNYNN